MKIKEMKSTIERNRMTLKLPITRLDIASLVWFNSFGKLINNPYTGLIVADGLVVGFESEVR